MKTYWQRRGEKLHEYPAGIIPYGAIFREIRKLMFWLFVCLCVSGALDRLLDLFLRHNYIDY